MLHNCIRPVLWSLLTEFALLSNLAQHVGERKKVEWDGPTLKITSIPELNQWVRRPYRKGWQI